MSSPCILRGPVAAQPRRRQRSVSEMKRLAGMFPGRPLPGHPVHERMLPKRQLSCPELRKKGSSPERKSAAKGSSPEPKLAATPTKSRCPATPTGMQVLGACESATNVTTNVSKPSKVSRTSKASRASRCSAATPVGSRCSAAAPLPVGPKSSASSTKPVQKAMGELFNSDKREHSSTCSRRSAGTDLRWDTVPKELKDMAKTKEMKDLIIKAWVQPTVLGLNGHAKVNLGLPTSTDLPSHKYQYFWNGHTEGMREKEVAELLRQRNMQHEASMHNN
eukprot:gnl/TRDRNA2_/TRDRNA2_191703_c0_seq1.p1 gnl/TRDRNA2_/TRDRNA2_191703_c0~~gnl/TRDRNA2_/TRDRNA2_191703_c0_seq1.p1  ORF type:complete len:277 (-),score=40.36 gnl/TRDRNA2_/TRDRNA2_191703_c0_seq1:23-853(-)